MEKNKPMRKWRRKVEREIGRDGAEAISLNGKAIGFYAGWTQTWGSMAEWTGVGAENIVHHRLQVAMLMDWGDAKRAKSERHAWRQTICAARRIRSGLAIA